MIGSQRHSSLVLFPARTHVLAGLVADRARLRGQAHFQLDLLRLEATRFKAEVARSVATSRHQMARSQELLSIGVRARY